MHHPNRNLLWVLETSPERETAQWWMLAADGTWRQLTLLTRQRRVLDEKSTRLALSSAQSLFANLAAQGFFALDAYYPSPDMPVEGTIVVVWARLDGQSARVIAHPPEFWPPALEHILSGLQQAGSGVTDGIPALAYWHTEQMDRDRAARVRRRNLLPHRSRETISPVLTFSLQQALANPGIWVAIESEELDQARSLMEDHDQIVIEGPTASWLIEFWVGRFVKGG